jgi:hypothetical protein
MAITSTKKPMASIAINRNQLKNYNNKFYLRDGQEFEVELYNPTTEQILGEIELNGTLMGSGIVLRPGERVFLDCVPDEDQAKRKKFKFETYKVDNTLESKEAIVKNGVIKIRFYNELEQIKKKINDYIIRERVVVKEVYPYWWTPWYNPYWYSTPSVYCNNTGNPIIGTTTTYNSGATFTSNNSSDTFNINYCASGDNKYDLGELTTASSKDNTKLETGRIELSDEVSKQNFAKVSAEWQSYAMHTIEFQLIPESRREELTINKIRQYCPECGTRVKKASWKFCPSCSEPLD